MYLISNFVMTECFPPGQFRKTKLLDELAGLGRDYRAHAEPDHMSVAGGDAIVPRKKCNSFEEKKDEIDHYICRKI